MVKFLHFQVKSCSKICLYTRAMYKTSYIKKKRGSCNTEKLYLESVISFKPRRVSITCPKGLEHDFDVTSHDWTASSRPPCLLSFLKSFCILWVGSVSSCLSESTNSLQTACHLQQQGNQLIVLVTSQQQQ